MPPTYVQARSLYNTRLFPPCEFSLDTPHECHEALATFVLAVSSRWSDPAYEHCILTTIVMANNAHAICCGQPQYQIHFAYGHDGELSMRNCFSGMRKLLLPNSILHTARQQLQLGHYNDFIDFTLYINVRIQQMLWMPSCLPRISCPPQMPDERQSVIRINTSLEREYLERTSEPTDVEELLALIENIR